MNFLEYIKNGDATKATALIETVLKQKTFAFIKEQRAAVAEATYGEEEELTEGNREPYDGPLPRKKHSHRCDGCRGNGQRNAVACYKAKCTKPQHVSTCSWCQGDPSKKA